mmetsp:Transcript_27767/g.42019  ORF Transcript_27767/g.42019 Transcript_27767/m.42019 type:complete len:339 (+) Transcript_27767:143-1159(+)|eukprot:CAMPEP_0178937256 /NCGR_PEP_ID=MMETSP0786-20121207/25647_1 /TAXON_ID=186022 /ORGANISM="Thalassionema frauenfeldii, Strain CCMP 1798" /LENGTH=338 /DNA_ID=CAMNT_0020615789 /DNA_START=134 /DNA_END=1150 /DNA_ORIENTATION=-
MLPKQSLKILQVSAVITLVTANQPHHSYGVVTAYSNDYSSSSSALYSCEFQSLLTTSEWSKPILFSGSPLIWEEGSSASPELIQWTETLGDASAFSLSEEGGNHSRNRNSINIATDFSSPLRVEKNHPISSLSHLIGTRDWFTGFANFEPLDHDTKTFWLDEFVLDTYLYSAGISEAKEGVGQNDHHHAVITKISDVPPSQVKTYTNTQLDLLSQPVARWRCHRSDEEETSDAEEQAEGEEDYSLVDSVAQQQQNNNDGGDKLAVINDVDVAQPEEGSNHALSGEIVRPTNGENSMQHFDEGTIGLFDPYYFSSSSKASIISKWVGILLLLFWTFGMM